MSWIYKVFTLEHLHRADVLKHQNDTLMQDQNENIHLSEFFSDKLAYCGYCCCRFVLPPNLTLKNFEGLDLGKMDQVN